MALKVLLPARTAAETAGVEFDSDHARRHNNENFVVSAPNLAASEEVDIEFLGAPGAWITYDVSGTPVVLTATQPHTTLPSGPLYRFKKDATVAAVAICVSY